MRTGGQSERLSSASTNQWLTLTGNANGVFRTGLEFSRKAPTGGWSGLAWAIGIPNSPRRHRSFRAEFPSPCQREFLGKNGSCPTIHPCKGIIGQSRSCKVSSISTWRFMAFAPKGEKGRCQRSSRPVRAIPGMVFTLPRSIRCRRTFPSETCSQNLRRMGRSIRRV